MTRRRKILLWLAGLLALGVIALGISAVVVLRSDWLREKIRIVILREIEDATGGRAEIGKFDFDWRTLRVEVRDFVLRGSEPATGPPLARVKTIALDLKVISFLSKKVDLLGLELNQPEVFLILDEKGRWNLPQPKIARIAKKPVQQFLDLEIDSVTIRQGLVRYSDRTIPLELRGEDLAAKFSFVRDVPAYRGDVAFRRVHVESPFATPFDLDLTTSIEIAQDIIRLPKLVVSHRDNHAELSGTLTPGKEIHARFKFTSTLALAQMGKILKFPEPHRGALRASGDLNIGGKDFSAHGKLQGDGVAYRQAGVLVDGIGVAATFAVTRSEARLDNLRVSALGGSFTGRATIHDWKRLNARGELRDLAIARVSRLRIEKPLPYAGILSGPVEVSAELGRAPNVTLAAKLAIAPVEGESPIEGMLDVALDQRTGKLEFGLSHLATPVTRVTFSGSLATAVRVGVVTGNFDDLLPALAFFSEEPPDPLPYRLLQSQARFEGEVTGSLEAPRIRGALSLGAFQFDGRAYGRFAADIDATPELLRVARVSLDRGTTRLTGGGEIALVSWAPSDASVVRGDFEVQGAAIRQVLADYGYGNVTVDGRASGAVHVEGTVGAPKVDAKLNLEKVTAWNENIDAVSVEGRYENNTARITAGVLRAGVGALTFSGSYEHRPGNYREGKIDFRYDAGRFRLGQWKAVEDIVARLNGDVEGRGSGSAELRDGVPRLVSLNGNFAVRNLSFGAARLGDVTLDAVTRGRLLHVDLAGSHRDSKAGGYVEWDLGDRSNGLGELRVSNLTVRTLQEFGFLGGPTRTLVFDGSVDAEVGFTGPVLEPWKWDAAARITRVEIAPVNVTPARRKDFTIRNAGTIVAYIGARGINVPSARLQSRDTDLTGSGAISFRARSPWNFQLKGTVNLAVLGALKEDVEARGLSTIDATIRGSFTEPQVNGRMELRDASFSLRGVPNGLEKANGVIRFDRTRATIESLTAMTGGGDIRLSGFVGFGGDEPVYRLQADAERVRVRYPDGISTSLSASLQWTGSARQSLVAGVVTVNRIGLTPNLDFGGLLAQSGRPTPAPAIDNEFLRGMQFDVRVVTAANAELQTSLTRDIQPEANLRLRGGPARPILLGRIAVNEGQINFFGNQYTITRGEVAFFNPVKLEPVLNMDLETKVRGVTVTINFTGPINRMNVSYRSDPPFESSEIVALLTVGRAPGSNVTPSAVAAQGGVLGAGGNTLLGNALSAPISGRLQKFFGVSRLKIDPELTGVANTPQARLTIEQQLSRDITLTYIANLNRTQQQIVRLQWDFSRDFSLLISREENGIFGADFQYRRRFK